MSHQINESKAVDANAPDCASSHEEWASLFQAVCETQSNELAICIGRLADVQRFAVATHMCRALCSVPLQVCKSSCISSWQTGWTQLEIIIKQENSYVSCLILQNWLTTHMPRVLAKAGANCEQDCVHQKLQYDPIESAFIAAGPVPIPVNDDMQKICLPERKAQNLD